MLCFPRICPMRLILPSCARLIAGALLAAAPLALLANAQGEGVETLLAFLEAHYDNADGVDGLDNAYDQKISPDGAHLYVASMNDDTVAIFDRDLETGSLTFAGRVKDGENGIDGLDGARALAVSPDGAFVYVASMFDHSLASFARNAQTGALAYLGRLADGEGGVDGLAGARSISISPDGKNLYVAGWGDNALGVFSRNPVTGAASFLGRLKNGEDGVAGLSEPHAVRVSPDGASVYVALWGEDAVSHFSRDASTGLLAYESKLVDGVGGVDGLRGPRALEVSADGEQLYVASWNDDAIAIFDRDTETGDLSYRSMARNGAAGVSGLDGPHSLTSSLDGRYLYVASFFSDAVTTFDRDLETGGLAFRQSLSNADEGIEGLNGALTVATSPDGQFVYLTASSDRSLVAFKRTVVIEPPSFVVQPVSRSIEEEESVAFYALAIGVDVLYQWFRDDALIEGETLPVLSIAAAPPADDGSVFHVVASNGGGSVESDAATLTVLPPVVVDAPQDLTALEISSHSARIAWTDASDNETGFEIQRRTANGSFATIANVFANQAQYDDLALSASTTYIYRLRARRNEAASFWSNDAVVESFADAPNDPADLTVAGSTYNKVRLAWRDRSAVEDGFRIQRRLDAEDSTWTTLATADMNATEYSDRDVLPDRTYAYRVQAYNASGSSGFTAAVVAITNSIPAQSISPTSRNIASDAASGFSVSVVSQEAWEAISDRPWLIVTSPAGGQGSGNQSVSYQVLKSESLSPRVGRIVIGGIEHVVTQAASAPFLRILPSQSDALPSGELVHVSIESNIAWTASETADWIEILSGASGSGYGTIVLQVAPNNDPAARIASLQINDREHEVEQQGRETFVNAVAAPAAFASAGGSGSVSIEANTAWSATAGADWLVLDGTASGDGDGAFGFSVAENASYEPRSAEILVNGQGVSISQEAVALSDIPPPSFLAADVGSGLGVALTWQDNSDTELGFILWRALAGSDEFVEVARLDPDVASHLDRDAWRGAAFVYRIASFDEIGYSVADLITSALLPDGGMARVVARGSVGPGDGLGLASFSYIGNGYIERRTQGFGRALGSLPFPESFARGLLRVGGSGSGAIGGPVASLDLDGEFDLRALAYPSLPDATFPSDDNGLLHAASRDATGGAWTRGVGLRGRVGAGQGEALVAFEIVGELTLPVLVKGVGASLSRQGASDYLADPRVELYRFEASGALALLWANDNWEDWNLDTPVALEDAVDRVGAIPLEPGNFEAALLAMLPPGRYGAVLRAPAGASGVAMLEVYDAR